MVVTGHLPTLSVSHLHCLCGCGRKGRGFVDINGYNEVRRTKSVNLEIPYLPIVSPVRLTNLVYDSRNICGSLFTGKLASFRCRYHSTYTP
jgi:hypothetical protein